jgi:hypothetical protein
MLRPVRTVRVTSKEELDAALASADQITVEGDDELLTYAVNRAAGDSDIWLRELLDLQPSSPRTGNIEVRALSWHVGVVILPIRYFQKNAVALAALGLVAIFAIVGGIGWLLKWPVLALLLPMAAIIAIVALFLSSCRPGSRPPTPVWMRAGPLRSSWVHGSGPM